MFCLREDVNPQCPFNSSRGKYARESWRKRVLIHRIGPPSSFFEAAAWITSVLNTYFHPNVLYGNPAYGYRNLVVLGCSRSGSIGTSAHGVETPIGIMVHPSPVTFIVINNDEFFAIWC